MYHIVYLTDNLINQKIYVGKHSTETPYEFDGYWGTNEYLKNAINKYGKENFKRYTLFVFETEKEAYTKEAEIVDADFVNRSDTYNLKTGGEGGWKHSEDTKKKISNARIGKYSGENNSFYGKHHSEDSKEKISENHWDNSGENNYWYEKTGENSFFYGKHHSPETKQKMSIAQSGENNSFYGKHHSEKTKQKISDNSANKLSPEVIKQRREDIKNIEKIWGYKSKLAGKWNKTPRTVTKFINKYAQDLVLDNFK